MPNESLKRGLYRTRDADRGECARVHWWAGDAAPYLERTIYEASGFVPRFEALPTKEQYELRQRLRTPRELHPSSV